MAKGAPGSQDAIALAMKLLNAWPKFKEIVTAPDFAHWDTMQDTKEVASNDPNSAAYSRVAAPFVA